MYQGLFELASNLNILLPYKEKIRCNKCGACCGNCPALVGKLCSVHPQEIGASSAAEHRGVICNDQPVELALRHGARRIACTEVVKLLETLGYSVVTEIDPKTFIPYFLSVSKQ